MDSEIKVILAAEKLCRYKIVLELKNLVVTQCAKEPEDREWFKVLGQLIDSIENENE
tara:strand:- start:240 stop:410 length:171 start_codon:yes stop_codon:yes gene_type:complete